MLYLKATFAGVMAALVGAVLIVVLPLCVQLIRLRWQTRGESAGVGAASFGFVLGFGFGIGLFLVVAVCFVGGFWWVVSRNT
jgi:Na+/melibiose symporter-like transporter